MNISRQQVITAFGEYVSRYNARDPKIKLKIDHTYRVASLCERIAASVTDEPELPDPDLSWLMGMLHDIGRFEQVRRFGTFSDALSVDHAALGADLLFCEDLLEYFVPEHNKVMTEKEHHLLELSIRSHSSYRLPENLTREEQMYCNLLRDADKVDIFRVNYDTRMEDIYNVTLKELKQAAVSPAVKQCFYNRTAVLRSLKQTAIDHLAGHICLYFELVYPASRSFAREQGYLDKLLEFQSDHPDTCAWFSYMKEHIYS